MFTRDTAGDLASGWTQVAKLTAGDGAEDDFFGSRCLDRAATRWWSRRAVDDTDKGAGSGSAYVFYITSSSLRRIITPSQRRRRELHRLFSERLVVHTDVRHRLLAHG